MSAKTANRIQATLMTGREPARYFAVTSEAARKIVEARTSRIPRRGRSRCPAAGVLVTGDLSGTSSLARSKAELEARGAKKRICIILRFATHRLARGCHDPCDRTLGAYGAVDLWRPVFDRTGHVRVTKRQGRFRRETVSHGDTVSFRKHFLCRGQAPGRECLRSRGPFLSGEIEQAQERRPVLSSRTGCPRRNALTLKRSGYPHAHGDCRAFSLARQTAPEAQIPSLCACQRR
jgi:hypothetical protein